jgi:predicted DsbA family dithiol-disulfide isomerase
MIEILEVSLMKKVEIILFQAGICDSCDVTWAIMQSLAGIINGYVGDEIVKLKHYTLGDEEGREAALDMGVEVGPTFFINGEKHEGKETGEEIFEAILAKLDIDKSKKDAIRKSLLD